MSTSLAISFPKPWTILAEIVWPGLRSTSIREPELGQLLGTVEFRDESPSRAQARQQREISVA
jgi:hypothetical protein